MGSQTRANPDEPADFTDEGHTAQKTPTAALQAAPTFRRLGQEGLKSKASLRYVTDPLILPGPRGNFRGQGREDSHF